MKKIFTSEVDRIFKLGRLTPNIWIKGKPLSVEPLLEAVRKVL